MISASQNENYLVVKWVGKPVIYTENTEQNGFNQFASITFQYRFTKLVSNWIATTA